MVAIKKEADWYTLRQDFSESGKCFDDSTPYVDVTVGCTFDFATGSITWNYQTGDNSFTGGAYGHPEWFNTSLFSRSNCKIAAADLTDEIGDRIYELQSYREV